MHARLVQEAAPRDAYMNGKISLNELVIARGSSIAEEGHIDG
jgi:hypothetical protein